MYRVRQGIDKMLSSPTGERCLEHGKLTEQNASIPSASDVLPKNLLALVSSLLLLSMRNAPLHLLHALCLSRLEAPSGSLPFPFLSPPLPFSESSFSSSVSRMSAFAQMLPTLGAQKARVYASLLDQNLRGGTSAVKPVPQTAVVWGSTLGVLSPKPHSRAIALVLKTGRVILLQKRC